MLKTHVDIMDDFSAETAQHLKTLASEHQFIVMEDRYCMSRSPLYAVEPVSSGHCMSRPPLYLSLVVTV